MCVLNEKRCNNFLKQQKIKFIKKFFRHFERNNEKVITLNFH